jgi:hypothetical protein
VCNGELLSVEISNSTVLLVVPSCVKKMSLNPIQNKSYMGRTPPTRDNILFEFLKILKTNKNLKFLFQKQEIKIPSE